MILVLMVFLIKLVVAFAFLVFVRTRKGRVISLC